MKRFVNEPHEIDGIRVVQDSNEIEKALKNGETVYHWEAGSSLTPLINHMEFCKIKPCTPNEVKRGDAVFCVISDENGNKYPMVHLVWEISDAGVEGSGLWFKIGSTTTTIFGWTQEVYGIANGTDIYQEVTAEIRKSWEEYEMAKRSRD